MDNGRWGGREVGKYTLMIRQGRVRAVEMILNDIEIEFESESRARLE